MKKAIFVAIFIFMIFVHPAYAKTILYVTNASTDSSCSDLESQDSLYCDRLSGLGYDLKVINEEHAKSNTSEWNEYADSSDMIFLGSVNFDMVNTSEFQDIFCGNISSKLNDDRTVFATLENTWINTSANIQGCAFHPSINLVSWSLEDNKCIKKTFKIAKEGFITEGYSVGDNLDLYSTQNVVKIHDISDGSWITTECTPEGGSIGFYPVINTSDKGVFWGVDNSKNFTDDAWNIFDRTVLTALDDTTWTITPIFIIPSSVTVNQTMWILANVSTTQTVDNVNFTADGVSGGLAYEDGFWRNLTVELPGKKQYSLEIRAYTPTMLRGTETVSVNAGILRVDILSGNYKPDSDYLIEAKIFVDSEPQTVKTASYRVLDSSSYTTVYSGSLACDGNYCSGKITKIMDVKSLVLEVIASNETETGGSFKTIYKELLTTDKDRYKPGETIKINFFPSEDVDSANLTIVRPDGSEETPAPIPMSKTGSKWSKDYTLGASAPNGTYTIVVESIKEDNVTEFNKTIDVIAWKAVAYINQYSFNVYETLELTVETMETYSSDLNFTVYIDIIDPDDNKVFTTTGFIEGDDNYSTTYLIQGDHEDGLSKIKVILEDSENRSATLELDFTVNFTEPSLFVTPLTVSELTIAGKIFNKNFTIENTATDVDVTNLIINFSGTLKDFIQIKLKPTSIPADSSSQFKIRIDTTNLSEGTNTGTIDIFSQVGSAQIYLSIEIIGDLYTKAEEKIDELYLLQQNITELESRLVDVTNVTELFNEIEDLLDEVITDFENEDYASAKSKFESAVSKLTGLILDIQDLYTEIPDYSFIIWEVAIVVVVIIVIVTLFHYRDKIKQLLKGTKKKEEEEEVEEVYYKESKEEYRTEYY